MTLRSLLFTPGDTLAKMEKAFGCGADAVVLDLEDAVAPGKKLEARTLTGAFVRSHRGPRRPELWVRINPLSAAEALEDLAAVMPGAPDGVVLPKPDSAADTRKLDNILTGFEAALGLDVGSTRILPIATETPKALFTLDSYQGSSERLAGLTWGAEDLPAAIGATTNRADGGGYSDVCRLARTLCLAAAGAAGLAPIETVYPDFRDLEGLLAYAARARRDGFRGMMAIHPGQIEVIHQAFTPSASELEEAARIVTLFEQNPTAGALSLEGRMIDAPHLRLARRLLGLRDTLIEP